MNVFDQHVSDRFAIYRVDTVEFTATLPDNSVDFIIYSPPFSALYVYSDSERDMGNVASHEEFAARYAPLVRELLRVLKPGRTAAVHCSDITTTKVQHGVIGLYDFPALVREVHETAGWVYASRTTVWKDPVVEMQRTKAHGLLYKTFREDASRCRTGMPDYLMLFRKPVEGANSATPEPVKHDERRFPVTTWQEIASPVWMSVNQTRVLPYQGAREEQDERHVCPLQLDFIERALHWQTNVNDLVYSPFMGIGSEGWCSVREGRRFIGTELKGTYFEQATLNLKDAEAQAEAPSLLGLAS